MTEVKLFNLLLSVAWFCKARVKAQRTHLQHSNQIYQTHMYTQDSKYQTQDSRHQTLDTRYWTLDINNRHYTLETETIDNTRYILDSETLDTRYWTLDTKH